ASNEQHQKLQRRGTSMRVDKQTAVTVATLLLGAALTVSSAFGAGKKQILTGEVSDAMCGAKHMMEGGSAKCTEECVDKGSKYALIVGDKVYTLEGADSAASKQLNSLAGKQAKVTGTVDGMNVQVASVAAK